MRLSKLFRLGRSQYELDFVDIDIAKDLPLFVDPYFLAHRVDQWSVDASRTLRSFFSHFVNLLRQGQSDEARTLFAHLGEPNETCLGLSRGRPRGRGVGEGFADRLFASLSKSKAVRTGIVEDLEDTRVFVPGIDKDRTSDMATNVIRGHLLTYTRAQCQLWGIPLQPGVPSGITWDRVSKAWTSGHTERLVVKGKPLLLVPKGVVSFVKKYTAEQYARHFVLNFLQHEHLRLNSALVQVRRRRDGSERRFVTKKSIVEKEGPIDKEFLARFTADHPDVFRNFRTRVKDLLASLSDEELTAAKRNDVIDHLTAELRSIPIGADSATQYHKTVVGVLELLFYPALHSPQVERDIHDGRKRIDITFDNAAKVGFFHNLHTIHKQPCGFIAVECKNYSSDPKNPELDQLSGRFSPNRGKVGLLVCREIDDMAAFIKRCTDTYKDDRGVVIPVVDADILDWLAEMRRGVQRPWEQTLRNRFRDVALA